MNDIEVRVSVEGLENIGFITVKVEPNDTASIFISKVLTKLKSVQDREVMSSNDLLSENMYSLERREKNVSSVFPISDHEPIVKLFNKEIQASGSIKGCIWLVPIHKKRSNSEAEAFPRHSNFRKESSGNERKKRYSAKSAEIAIMVTPDVHDIISEVGPNGPVFIDSDAVRASKRGISSRPSTPSMSSPISISRDKRDSAFESLHDKKVNKSLEIMMQRKFDEQQVKFETIMQDCVSKTIASVMKTQGGGIGGHSDNQAVLDLHSELEMLRITVEEYENTMKEQKFRIRTLEDELQQKKNQNLKLERELAQIRGKY